MLFQSEPPHLVVARHPLVREVSESNCVTIDNMLGAAFANVGHAEQVKGARREERKLRVVEASGALRFHSGNLVT